MVTEAPCRSKILALLTSLHTYKHLYCAALSTQYAHKVYIQYTAGIYFNGYNIIHVYRMHSIEYADILNKYTFHDGIFSIWAVLIHSSVLP